MKIFRTVILSFLLFSFILASLSGCHGSVKKNEFIIPNEFDTSKNYQITFWAKNDTNKAQTNIYQKAIENFEALYPNITVTIRLYTDYGKIYNDVITNISTDTTPDVCITYPDYIATYMTGENVVVPLDNLFTDEKYGFGGSLVKFNSVRYDEMIPQFLDECKLSGNYYAVPFMRSTEACYINKTYVEALGYTLPDMLTWDFIWEVSDAATKKDADGNFLVNGQKVMIPFIYKSTDNMMIQMLRQKNAGYSTNNGKIEIFNDTTKELLLNIAEHTAKGSFSTFKISSYPANFLNRGQCIFAIDSTAGATWMGSNAPLSDINADSVVDFETAVMAVPQFDTENPQMISQGPSICIFAKDDPGQVLASWLFTQYLLTNEVQVAYSQTEGYIPVTSKAQNSEEYQQYLADAGKDNKEHYDIKIKASRLLLDNTDNTFVTPVFNGSASLRNAAGQLVENVTKSVRRHEDVNDDYIASLYTDVSALYRLDQFTETGPDGSITGGLGAEAIILISSISAVWVLLISYYIYGFVKKRRKTSKYR